MNDEPPPSTYTDELIKELQIWGRVTKGLPSGQLCDHAADRLQTLTAHLKAAREAVEKCVSNAEENENTLACVLEGIHEGEFINEVDDKLIEVLESIEKRQAYTKLKAQQALKDIGEK